MANARGRLKETRASTKSQGRGRVSKKDNKVKTSSRAAKFKEYKDELKTASTKNMRTTLSRQKQRASRSLSDEPSRVNGDSHRVSTRTGGARHRAHKTFPEAEKLGTKRKTANNKKCKSLNDNLAVILTKELTKKTSPKKADVPLERGAQEPQIITMKMKTDDAGYSSVNSSSTSASSQPTRKRRKSSLPAHGDPLPQSADLPQKNNMKERIRIDPAKNPPPSDVLLLPVRVEQYKPGKIEDINVLRSMLKMRKIKLSNGVQITVPPTKSPAYECDHCGRTFRAKQDLRKHMLIHLDVKPHACPLCDSRFRQRGNLKTHMTRKHASALPAPEQFVCHHCGARFFVKEAIRAHVLKHEPMKAYRCRHCDKGFARDIHLRAHLRSHHGACRFYCYLCSASYSTRLALDEHIKRHLGMRDLVCHVCGKAFARLDCIKKHIAALHQEVKRFQCPVCSKWLKGHLREHMRTHVHSKPYACLECGKRFAQTSQLAVHKRSHTGIKPYFCRVCKRPFSHSNALVLHIRIHTGEKPFECAMCPQTFSQLPHMKAHMLNIHNKSEAYKCVDCGEFFKLRASLEEHRLKCAAAEATPWLRALPDHPPSSPATPPITMSLSKMRFLLAILLQTIADEDRLHVLALIMLRRRDGGGRAQVVVCCQGLCFNKRLIDDLLVDSLEATGHAPVKDPRLSPAARLRDNIRLLLDWTVPPDIMRRFRQQNKSTEQLLEELTS